MTAYKISIWASYFILSRLSYMTTIHAGSGNTWLPALNGALALKRTGDLGGERGLAAAHFADDTVQAITAPRQRTENNLFVRGQTPSVELGERLCWSALRTFYDVNLLVRLRRAWQ